VRTAGTVPVDRAHSRYSTCRSVIQSVTGTLLHFRLQITSISYFSTLITKFQELTRHTHNWPAGKCKVHFKIMSSFNVNNKYIIQTYGNNRHFVDYG
jgi:hypothetical protein